MGVRNSVASGFAPWIVFWVVSSPSTWKWAAGHDGSAPTPTPIQEAP